MELNWPTFGLEIVNFLVLVWILKRFLYKPVLAAIARRKAAIDKTLAAAAAKESDARGLEEQYRNRLAEWEGEKERLRAALAQDIGAQRGQMMAGLESALKQEREKAHVLEQRRFDDLRQKAEEEGLAKGVKFTARLLARAAGPELEAKFVDLTLADLTQLSDEQIKVLRSASQQGGLQVKVTSAFPLGGVQRALITERLKAVTQDTIVVDFNEDGRLLAGLRISLGPWVLRANLEDELAFFAEAVRHGS